MTTPTINEIDSTNMPGVYWLLLDEDMSIAAGNITEQMAFWVTHAGIPAIFLEVELFKSPIEADIIKVAGGPDITPAGTGGQLYGE